MRLNLLTITRRVALVLAWMKKPADTLPQGRQAFPLPRAIFLVRGARSEVTSPYKLGNSSTAPIEIGRIISLKMADSQAIWDSYCAQSSGGAWMPHTLPGSSSANPSSQSFVYSPSEMQFTTRAAMLVTAGRPSN